MDKYYTSPSSNILISSSRNNGQNFLLGVNLNSGNNEIYYHFIDSEGDNIKRTGIGYESGWRLESISLSDNGFLTLSSFDKSENLSKTDCQLIKIIEMGGIEWLNYSEETIENFR